MVNAWRRLDCALKAGSGGVGKHLLLEGCEPSKLYIIEDCGFKLQDMLQKLRPADVLARSRKLLKTSTAFEAARAGDLSTLGGLIGRCCMLVDPRSIVTVTLCLYLNDCALLPPLPRLRCRKMVANGRGRSIEVLSVITWKIICITTKS